MRRTKNGSNKRSLSNLNEDLDSALRTLKTLKNSRADEEEGGVLLATPRVDLKTIISKNALTVRNPNSPTKNQINNDSTLKYNSIKKDRNHYFNNTS
jgi:hypothetical protein